MNCVEITHKLMRDYKDMTGKTNSFVENLIETIRSIEEKNAKLEHKVSIQTEYIKNLKEQGRPGRVIQDQNIEYTSAITSQNQRIEQLRNVAMSLSKQNIQGIDL